MDTLAEIITVGAFLLPLMTLIWTIAWTIISSRQAKANTKQLNQIQKEVEQSNRLHDQSVQRLYRAREAVIAMHKATVYLIEYVQAGKDDGTLRDDNYFTKRAELSAAQGELRGIAIAIGNQEFLNIINQRIHNGWAESSPIYAEVEARGYAQELHTQITKLLEDATTIGAKTGQKV